MGIVADDIVDLADIETLFADGGANKDVEETFFEVFNDL